MGSSPWEETNRHGKSPLGEVRDIYLKAAASAVQLLGNGDVARAWEDESVLVGMSVGALAGHLARSVLQVEWFLDGQAVGAELVSPVRYYARLVGTPTPGSSLNVGVRARCEETASLGPAVVSQETSAALARLRGRLDAELLDRRVAVPRKGNRWTWRCRISGPRRASPRPGSRRPRRSR